MRFFATLILIACAFFLGLYFQPVKSEITQRVKIQKISEGVFAIVLNNAK